MRAGTKAEYARQRGWSKAYLSKAEVKERLADAEFVDAIDGKKKLDFDKADEIFERTADPARKKPTEKNTLAAPENAETRAAGEGEAAGATSAPDTAAEAQASGPGYHDIKTRRELLKLKEEELAYEVRLGNTLSREDVHNATILAGKMLQDKLKSRNKRLADALQTISDPLVIKTKMDESDREILQELSDALIERLSPTSNTPAPVTPH